MSETILQRQTLQAGDRIFKEGDEGQGEGPKALETEATASPVETASEREKAAKG